MSSKPKKRSASPSSSSSCDDSGSDSDSSASSRSSKSSNEHSKVESVAKKSDKSNEDAKVERVAKRRSSRSEDGSPRRDAKSGKSNEDTKVERVTKKRSSRSEDDSPRRDVKSDKNEDAKVERIAEKRRSRSKDGSPRRDEKSVPDENETIPNVETVSKKTNEVKSPSKSPTAVADEVEEGECADQQEDEDVKPKLSSLVTIAKHVPKTLDEMKYSDRGSDRGRRHEGRRREEERRRRDRSVSYSRSRSRDRRRDRSVDRSRRDRDRSRDYGRNRGRDRYEDRSRKGRDRSRTPDESSDKAVKNEPEESKDPEVIPRKQQRTVDLLTSRTGGAYIPPAKLRLLQAEITDKSSAAYQRIAWEALKKSIHGYINKVNVDNIGIITRELLKENIVRGRGLLSKSIIQAQAASITFTHVYAALVSVINSKFPNIGELLLKRLVIQFKRGFRRNDKTVCLSASRFIAHLVNQRVAHEILALEILTLLVETPTDDSVEVAIAFLKESGMKLQEVSSKGVNAIFEMLKNILHEGRLDKRVQYMIEVVFQVRKDGFKDHLAVPESLELVEEDDQFTHLIMLDEATDSQDVLNVFKFDPEYQENEQKYKGLSKELLGSDGSSSDESGSGSGSDEDSSEDEEEAAEAAKQDMIIDQTETNLVALRRTIYLTIHSSLDYEECAHKLMKMELKPGQEMELCHMFLDCCAEQRTYEKFYGLLAQRFCNINKIYIPPFEEIFKDTYATTHRLDTNRLRNVSKFFAHLLFTDAIGWDVFECIRLNEDDTTSSSRIFIKILFQELAEYMGLGKLNARLKDVMIQESFAGLFPRDNPRNTRFAVNFFTSIGLGGLTDELREHLKNVPKLMTPIVPANDVKVDSSSSSSSSSSDSSSDSSSSDSSSDSSDSSDSSSDSDSSDDGKKKKKKKTSKTQSKRKADDKKTSKKVEKKKSRKDDKEDRGKADKNRDDPRKGQPRRRDDSEERGYNRRDDVEERRGKESSRNGDRDAKKKSDRNKDSPAKDTKRSDERRRDHSPDEADRRDRKRRHEDKPRSREDRRHRSRSADSNSSRRAEKSIKAEPDVSYWGRKVDYESDVDSKRRRRDDDRRRTKRSISSERG